MKIKSNKINSADFLITVGKVVSLYGVKGLIKIKSYTEKENEIFNYKYWIIKKNFLIL